MKILLQYGASSKIVELFKVEDIFNLVEQTYKLVPNSYLLKKYDKDFEEYVDLGKNAEISDKDKFKIENVICPTLDPSVSDNTSTLDFSAFLSQDTQIDKLSVDVVLNLKKKGWPKKVLLPVEEFSRPLKVALEEKHDLNWELSRELIGHLANYAYKYDKYPSKIQRQQICLSLVELFPYLKSEIGLGIGYLEIKLMNKLKRLRQVDSSLEVGMVRKACSGGGMPKKIAAKRVKGALNWAPDHFPEENESTQAHHIEVLRDECLKDEGCQDKIKIKNLMALTYSFRRIDVNNKMSINDMLKKYPIFFQVNEQFEEFERLTSVDILKVFTLNAMKNGSKLLKLFRMRNLRDEHKSFLNHIDFHLNSINTEHKRFQAESSYGVMILPFLLKEPINSFFEFTSPDDNTPDLGSIYPVIHGDVDVNGVFDITIEGQSVMKVKTFLLAVMLLVSYYYTLNISYCKDVNNSLIYIQHVLLGIVEDKLPPKVNNLIKKSE